MALDPQPTHEIEQPTQNVTPPPRCGPAALPCRR